MKLIYKNNYFAIYDEFLEKECFELIWTFIQEEQFHFHQADIWKKINRLSDGNHLEGKGCSSPNAPTYTNILSYPTGTAIDLINNKVQQHLKEFQEIVGYKENDWSFYTLKPFLYPKNTSISWHDDYTKSSGTFTFYCHPKWNIQWGGELIIATTSKINSTPQFRKKYGYDEPQPIGPYLDNKEQNRIVMDPGYGTYILPKPNRLVIMRAGVNHMVKKVEDAAGDKVRASIQGFFHSPNKTEGRY